MKIAICQPEVKFEDKEYNLKTAKELIEKVTKEKVNLILFPEMSFTGFSMNTNKIGEEDNYTINIIKELAHKNDVYIGFGWVKNKSMSENHYTIVNAKKEIILDYTKIHPFSFSNEDKYFVSGKGVSVCKIDNTKISAFICYDLRFPEIFQVVSNKASFIIVAANWPDRRIEHWKCLIKARAIENQCYVIGINCSGNFCGDEYSGISYVANPNGDIICEGNRKTDMLVIDIEDDVDKYRKDFPIKKDRQEELYKRLKM